MVSEVLTFTYLSSRYTCWCVVNVCEVLHFTPALEFGLCVLVCCEHE